MKSKDLAERVYEDLNEKGGGLGNASIWIIKKTLDNNGVVEHASFDDTWIQIEEKYNSLGLTQENYPLAAVKDGARDMYKLLTGIELPIHQEQ